MDVEKHINLPGLVMARVFDTNKAKHDGFMLTCFLNKFNVAFPDLRCDDHNDVLAQAVGIN